MQEPRIQLNARVPNELKAAVDAIRKQWRYTNDEMVVAAFSALFGVGDGEMRERCKKLKSAAQEMSLSFNDPNSQLSLDIAA